MDINPYWGDRHYRWRQLLGVAGERILCSVAALFVISVFFSYSLMERNREELGLYYALRARQSAASRDRGMRKLQNLALFVVEKHLTSTSPSDSVDRALSLFSSLRVSVAALNLLCRNRKLGKKVRCFISQQRDRRLIPLLFDLYCSDSDFSQHWLKKMHTLDSRASVAYLVENSKEGKPLALRLRSLNALAEVNCEKCRRALEKYLFDEEASPFVRRRSLKLLMEKEAWLCRENLEQVLDDRDSQIRRLAGRRLLALGPISEEQRYRVFCSLHWNDVEWFSGVLKERSKGSSIDGFVPALAREYGLEPALVWAVIHTESNFDTQCVSRAGARGLMQLMPKTAKLLGVQDPFDPRENVAGGVKYLKRMLQRFNGDQTLALAAYNAGPTAVSRYGGVPPYSETRRYLRKVDYYLSKYRARSLGPW